MLDPSLIETFFRQSSPDEPYPALARLLPENAPASVKIHALEAALGSPAGRLMRAEIGKWIVDRFVPVEALVPEEYVKWRAPVRDAMLFVVSKLCDARLAPKILEQIELPADTPPEIRLLRLIAKVPGLQKLGQVLARNRHLRPSLRNALSQLENGIHDITAEETHAVIERELGERLQSFQVRLQPALLSEASVSAVVRFTWHNPESGQRERGVFKVLKPYIPACFAEDMDILQGLAAFFGTKYREYGFAKHVLTDTFSKVRRLLQHEVDFVGEQTTLLEAVPLYRSMSGVRVPRVIPALCTSKITALTEEHGVKVTDAVARMPGLAPRASCRATDRSAYRRAPVCAGREFAVSCRPACRQPALRPAHRGTDHPGLGVDGTPELRTTPPSGAAGLHGRACATRWAQFVKCRLWLNILCGSSRGRQRRSALPRTPFSTNCRWRGCRAPWMPCVCCSKWPPGEFVFPLP